MTKSPNVIRAITEALLSDDVNQSKNLILFYHEVEPEDKELIDSVLIFICGYSMPTLIKQAEEETHGDED